MIETIPILDLEKNADNVYEAIIVAARRARQVNNEQKELLMREREEYEDDYDGYDLDEVAAAMKEQDYISFPKPATVALKELMEGKIKFYYREPAEDEEEAK